jgi:hypothetical protein
MGSSSSKIDFINITDGCRIGDSVISVDGLSASSASPSDQWILSLRGASYGNRPIKKAFLKWFIKPEEIRERMKKLGESRRYIKQVVANLRGLEYEIKVYRDIISPLIVNNVCPNFVKFLTDGDSCNRQDIVDILLNKTKTDSKFYGKTLITKEDMDFNINRNIAYIFTSQDGRPSINDTTEDISTMMNVSDYEYDSLREIIQTNNFQFLLTEAITNDADIKTVTLHSFLATSLFDPDDLYKIFFQMIFACYAMTLSGMNHMDLHSGNVYIEKRKTPIEVVYVTDIHTYKFMTNYKVLVYDFDFSYVERLGDNMKMADGIFKDSNMTNENIRKRDIAKCSYYVWNEIHNIDEKQSNEFLELILNNPTRSLPRVVDIYRTGSFLQQLQSSNLVAADNWDDWAEHDTILSRLANTSYGEIVKTDSWLGRTMRNNSITINESEILKSPPLNKHERVFICSPRLFMNNGELDVGKTKSVFAEISNVYKKL